MHDFALGTPATANPRHWRESIAKQIASLQGDVELAADHRYVPAMYWLECRTICIWRLFCLLQKQKILRILSFGSKITKIATFPEER
jgi:hypothetical protein